MTPEIIMKLSPKKLMALGYRRTSNAFGIVSRIDREDWKEHMAIRHSPWSLEEGMEWIKCLGESSAEDHYRRCYSKDNIEFGKRLAYKVKHIESSNGAPTGYIKEGK
jgi:hypothetical protein